jgi:tRNA(Arg) A34 adenosine deaminase TadA
VLVDGGGEEVARGTNARYAPAGSSLLAGSHVAHAEVIALAALDAHGTYPEYVLYTTLEPCLLCVGAAIMSTVGEVRFAGVDPYAGATSVVRGSNAHIDRVAARFTGPLTGAAGAFAAGLHVEFCGRRGEESSVVAAYRATAPGIVAAADVMASLGVPDAAATGAPLPEVYDRVIGALG